MKFVENSLVLKLSSRLILLIAQVERDQVKLRPFIAPNCAESLNL